MTTMRLFSDPHLGVTRTAHTTQASRTRLKRALFEQANKVATSGADLTACLGDLFDTYGNDGNTLMQGYQVMRNCDLVLVGNHDVANRSDSLSSLECLFAISEEEWGVGAEGVDFHGTLAGGCSIYWVHHKLTQDLFERTLERLLAAVLGRKAILLLHCNYNSPFATDASTLNLTSEMAERLLEVFEHIFIGHEHMPRTEFDGRLVLVGNTHPTSFADISDKYYWDVDLEDGSIQSVTKTLIWEKDTGHLSIAWADLPELSTIDDKVQFIDVTGEAQAQHMPTIAKQVSDLWSLSDNLLMVRNNVTCVTEAIEERPVNTYQDIPSRITHELRESHLSELWHKYLDKIGEIA